MPLRAAWVWLSLLLLASESAAAPAIGNADPKSAIAECSARVGEEKSGLSELEKDCPSLQAALEQSHLRPLIIDSSRAVLDRHSLLQLQKLMHSARGPAPDVGALKPILQDLKPTVATRRSWWQRVLDWLVEHLVPSSQQNSYPWLQNLWQLASRARWLWTAIFWVTIVALPIAVAIIVIREVRAMGRRSRDHRVSSGKGARAGPSQSPLALLRQVPLGQRPAQLFALLIGRLVAVGRLPPDRSLTHREVVRRAVLDDAEQRRLIEALARLSERQLYAGTTAAPEGLAELLARGEDLYTTGWAPPAGT